MKTTLTTSVLLVGAITVSSAAFAMGGSDAMMSGHNTMMNGSTQYNMHANTGGSMMSGSMMNATGSTMNSMHSSMMSGSGNTMMSGSTMSGKMTDMKQMCNGKKIAEMLKGKFRSDLTDGEKISMKKLVDSHVSDMKSMMDGADYSKMIASHDAFVASIKAYLDPSKKDAFIKSMDNMKSMMGSMHGATSSGNTMVAMMDRGMMGDMMQGAHSTMIGKRLSQQETTLVQEKLKSIGNNQSRLDAILAKIDKFLSGSAKESVKQKLQEIKDLIISNDVVQLPEAKPTPIIDLKNGDTYDITVSRVKKMIGGKEVIMLAYNGSVPGPTIRATKGSTIKIRLTNTLEDMDTTLHSHGVRLDEAFDGVPPEQGGKTAVSKTSGNTVEYTIKFPDTGAFWYHPHIRDDIGQGMGLYGNYIVSDTASGFTNPVNSEKYLFLSDILINNGKTASFPKDITDHAIMGRYGNTLLVNGTDKYALDAKKGDVIRLYLTNAASARTFQFSIPGAKLKLVGSDMGKYAKETFVDSVLIAPAERYVVEAYFPNSGTFTITHTTPDKTYTLGSANISTTASDKDNSASFGTLKTNADIVTEMSKFEPYYAKKADKNISFSLAMKGMGGMSGMMGGNGGMSGMMGGMMNGGMMGGDLPKNGLEWEDTMGAMNAASNSDSITWQITDTDTNKVNGDIDWSFKKGDLVKIRVSNDTNTMHPMQHPFHIHGQRFIILDENGKKNESPVWKDTVLVRAGQSVDILVDMSNPGKWMDHCHITEHLHSGMMLGFSIK